MKQKLSLVWAALMFFYVHGDYFGLYVPGQLQGMLAGEGLEVAAPGRGLKSPFGLILRPPATPFIGPAQPRIGRLP